MSSAEPTTDPKTPEAPPTACVQCGHSEFSIHTKLPVCEPCRMTLVKYPFPGWVKFCAVMVAVLVCCSLALSRERIFSAMSMTRAQKMAREQRWEEAYQAYQGLVDKNTRNIDTLLTYTETALNSGHYEEAAKMLDGLSGQPATKVQISRAQSLDDQLVRVAGRMQQPLGGGAPGTQFLPSVLR